MSNHKQKCWAALVDAVGQLADIAKQADAEQALTIYRDLAHALVDMGTGQQLDQMLDVFALFADDNDVVPIDLLNRLIKRE
jgi:hypothetical protein